MVNFVGNTVVDPFIGMATTNVATAKWGRNSIGVEVDSHYFEMAAKRMDNELPKLFSRRTVRLHEKQASFGFLRRACNDSRQVIGKR